MLGSWHKWASTLHCLFFNVPKSKKMYFCFDVSFSDLIRSYSLKPFVWLSSRGYCYATLFAECKQFFVLVSGNIDTITCWILIRSIYTVITGVVVFLFCDFPGGSELQHAGRPRCLLRCHQPVRELREHDHHLLHQGLLLWQAGGGESGGEGGFTL